MNVIDIVILVALVVFIFNGWLKGFLKKIISLGSLFLGIIIATRYASTLGYEVLEPMGIAPGISVVISYMAILGGIILVQAVVYRIFVKEAAEGLWNKICGAVFGFVEGGLAVSIVLIFLSLYFHVPSDRTRSESLTYKNVKNFAPLVYDSIVTLIPETEDFYQSVFYQHGKEKPKQPGVK
jgi:membrane protein required for colicin V production